MILGEYVILLKRTIGSLQDTRPLKYEGHRANSFEAQNTFQSYADRQVYWQRGLKRLLPAKSGWRQDRAWTNYSKMRINERGNHNEYIQCLYAHNT